MRLRSIPTDIAISVSFVGVFLLAFVPCWLAALISPDLLLVIVARAKLKPKPGQ